MKVAAQGIQRLDDSHLSRSEWARLLCALAKEFEDAGNYEAARQALGELWQRVGERPLLDGLDSRGAAELLLRAGTLSGWIGSARQIAGAQEFAKNLISESISIFESLDEMEKAAEGQIELAYCYWREGALDEARIILSKALGHLVETNSEIKAVAFLRSAIVESSANRLNEALHILTAASHLFAIQNSHSLRGRFHNELASTLKDLSVSERRDAYLDRALVEYAAASFHFEQAGHTTYRAAVENNLGSLLFQVARFDEAHQHLDRARRLFVSLKDTIHIAQVDKTRARALLAQNRNAEAESLIRMVVRTLAQGGEQALLAEALNAHGIALARLGQHTQSKRVLERAIEVAEQAGDLENAGRAALSLLEEHRTHLTAHEHREIYRRADDLLSRSQHMETLVRLRECARQVVGLDQSSAKDKTAPRFVYAAESTAALLRQAQRLAATHKALLIKGERGTGKETLARLVHEWSGRAGKFLTISCTSRHDLLADSPLSEPQQNAVLAPTSENDPLSLREIAGGTLFLDEVAELSRSNQVRLLRLIERGEIYRTDASAPEFINVRVIAATTRDLRQEVSRGNFRDDLFYRLSTFQIEIPPLRERPEDIPAIAQHFIEEASEQYHKRLNFTRAGLDAMQNLSLRSNVRELRALIEKTFLTAADGTEISAGTIETIALRRTQKAAFADAWEEFSLEEEMLRYEAGLIRRALEAAEGRITHAARLLGTSHQGLAFILNTRHKELLEMRRPARPRSRTR